MISFFARNGVAANLLMATIAIAGIYTLSTGRIPVEVFPSFEEDWVNIGVTYRGATPEEVEESIVVKIDEAIVDVEGIERIVSTARESRGSVNVDYSIDPGDEGTVVTVDADVHLSGAAAQFGRTGLIKEMSTRLIDEFVHCVEAKLSAETEEEAAEITAGEVKGLSLFLSSMSLSEPT